ncbi:MAG: 3-deoxy-manno-octulosonate cytidylyltransferase (CMP-KDO synthetase) [Paraglaciecola sp.]
MTFKIVIPARFGSSRLPGKPLLGIAGKPMIWHVYQQALATGVSPEDIVIATDDQRIVDAALGFKAQVVMTSPNHESGTERLAEVVTTLGWHDEDIVVNVQGDEPLVPPQLIILVANRLAETPQAAMATLAARFGDRSMLNNPNVVKVVLSEIGNAHYFSRAPIPFVRDERVLSEKLNKREFLRHIGIYSYRVATIKKVVALAPNSHELAESLEQLRPLCNGLAINVAVIDQAPPHGVDTPEDLERVRAEIAHLSSLYPAATPA